MDLYPVYTLLTTIRKNQHRSANERRQIVALQYILTNGNKSLNRFALPFAFRMQSYLEIRQGR